MESIYNPQAPYYYLEVSQSQMDTVLSNSEFNHPILEQFGYPDFNEISKDVKKIRGITDSIQLKHVLMAQKELENGNWGISVQITPYKYWHKPSTAVQSRLTSDQFSLVLQYFEVVEVLTREEYLLLKQKNK